MSFAATLTVDRQFPLAPLDRRLFGVFVEHLGRCVYNGIHEFVPRIRKHGEGGHVVTTSSIQEREAARRSSRGGV